MGLSDIPPTRNTTYSPGVSPVKGNDLNAIQDAIIKRGSLHSIAFDAAAFRTWPAGSGIVGVLNSNSDRWIKGTDTAFAVRRDLQIPVGAKINRIVAYAKRGNVASSSFYIELRYLDKAASSGGHVQVGIASDNGIDGAIVSLTLTVDHIVLADKMYSMVSSQSSQAAANGFEFIGATVHYWPF